LTLSAIRKSANRSFFSEIRFSLAFFSNTTLTFLSYMTCSIVMISALGTIITVSYFLMACLAWMPNEFYVGLITTLSTLPLFILRWFWRF